MHGRGNFSSTAQHPLSAFSANGQSRIDLPNHIGNIDNRVAPENVGQTVG
jgi:hypothetical protein